MIAFVCTAVPALLLTKRIAVPKRGEIPLHEQFYYLELLRRAGWIDFRTLGQRYDHVSDAAPTVRAIPGRKCRA